MIKDRNLEIIQSEESKVNRMKKSEESLPDYRIPSKETICKPGVPEGEERKKGAKSLLKVIITEHLPTMGSDRGIQVHKAHRSPNQLNLKKSSPSHIIIKLSKIKHKERILKSARIKKIVTYKGTPIRLYQWIY